MPLRVLILGVPRSGTTWTERAYLKAPNAQPYDEFGSAVAVSGDGTTLAVAA